MLVNNLNNNEKIALIKKHFKKSSVFLDLALLNYKGYNLYIVLTKLKKYKSYRLNWFDLDNITDENIEKYVSFEYIPAEIIDLIKNEILKYNINFQNNDEFLPGKDMVIMNIYVKTENADNINIKFNKYLPISLAPLSSIFVFIFQNMSKKYEDFLPVLLAQITGTTEKYEYKDEFKFDLFKGNINTLFSSIIIQRGQKYYEDEKVKFLEKIDDRYFAIVTGTKKYLVIIKYNEPSKIMQVYCSCPCEFYCKHIYAVILAIRNNNFNKFYKIIYKNPNKSLLERVMDFDYFLCLGVVNSSFEIINNDGELELVPILEANNSYNWEILEDSDDKKLMKQIKHFLDNK